MRLSSAVALMVAVAAVSAAAQDTRHVVEPTIPPVCVKLAAQLHAAPEGLAADDETKLDTGRIQQAINRCTGKGQAVELAAAGGDRAFLAGSLELKAGVVLLVDAGVTLFGSRDPKVYEKAPGSCGLVNQEPAGCRALIFGSGATNAGIMGDGIIDGRGGAKLLGQEKTWWQLADDARAGGRQQVPRMIEIDKSDHFTIYRITLKNSANFHVSYSRGDGFTVWGLKIDTPKNARNTDGVDPSGSTNITVTHSFIRTGDDNIAIKGGVAPVTNMSVLENHFYYGHGMSIGSETNAGVSKVLIDDLTLDGTESGIRIKSNATRGGLVKGITYNNICIRNSNHPIQLDTSYSYAGSLHDSFPTFEDIVLHDVRISESKTISFNGYDHTHRIGVQLDGVLLDHPATYKFEVKHADLKFGPGPVNFMPTGDDSTLAGKAGSGNIPSCDGRFVPFPVTK